MGVTGVPLENISRLVGHRTTTVTETVYRKQLRPVIEDAATAMNRIFPADDVSHSVTNWQVCHQVVCLVGATGFEPVPPSLVRRNRTVAGRRLKCQLARLIVARGRLASLGNCLCRLPVWLPGISLARLRSSISLWEDAIKYAARRPPYRLNAVAMPPAY